MNLRDQTPVEIDTALYALYEREGKASDRLGSARVSIHQTAGSRKVYRGRSSDDGAWDQSYEAALSKVSKAAVEDKTYKGTYAQNALNAMVEAKETLRQIRKEMDVLNAEFEDRGGWSRAFLVQNTNGHVHRSMNCSTCYPSTRFAWMVAYSGKPEVEIVEDAGELACTVCYPSAPVDVLARPTKMFGPEQIAAQKAREERAAAKADRDAKRIAKALTADGSEFKVSYASGQRRDGTPWVQYERFKTEASASQWVVAKIANGYEISEGERVAMNEVMEAIGQKHGWRIEAVQAEIDRKVAAKIKRDAR